METLLYSFAQRLDLMRARLLELTLALPCCNAIFRDRSRRLWWLFTMAATSSLLVSLYFPLVVLLIGPILYGYPHLFASFRYVGDHLGTQNRSRSILFFSTVFFAISTWRILIDLRYLAFPHFLNIPNLPELVSLGLSAVGCGILFQKNYWQMAKSLLLLFPVVYFSWKIPNGTIGLLLLIHNLVAFLYWIFAAQSKRGKRTALLATALFCFINFLLFKGAFDFLFHFMEPGLALPFAQLDFMEFGRLIFPSSSDGGLWYHATVAYAFGQSMHYFVWLKAIPDERHHEEVPTSFRQSLNLAKKDFGPFYFKFLLLFLIFTSGLWAIMAIPFARTIYFSISAYHGYLELVGLSFTTLKTRES